MAEGLAESRGYGVGMLPAWESFSWFHPRALLLNGDSSDVTVLLLCFKNMIF